MHSYCLNFIPHFSSICSSFPLLAGPIEISRLLCSPSFPENETNRMHYIPLGRDVEQRDLPSFFTNDIKSGKGKSVSCEITDHPGLSCFLLTERGGGEYGNVLGSACTSTFPVISCWGQSCQGWLCVHLLWWRQAQRLSQCQMEAVNFIPPGWPLRAILLLNVSLFLLLRRRTCEWDLFTSHCCND